MSKQFDEIKKEEALEIQREQQRKQQLKSSAAAPQVVADERAAFDPRSILDIRLSGQGLHKYLNGDPIELYPAEINGLLSEAYSVSTPVQEQEPVAFKEVGSFLYVGVEYVATSSDDPRGIKLYRPTVAPVQAQEPVAEVSAMPGTSGFTIAVFKADDMPIGSKVFRAPAQPVAVPDGKYGRLTGDNVAQPVQMKGKEK